MPALAVAAVLGVGGVAAAAALSGNGTPHSEPAATPAATSTAPVIPPPTSPTAPATTRSPLAPTTPTATKPGGADFSVNVVRGISWVQVVGPGGHVLFAGVLRHGRTLSYPQRPLRVTIGDAGAVRLVLHHRAHDPAGRRGAVLRFTYR